MKAVAVYPGKPGSAHLADIPDPSIDSIPGGRGVLVRVLRVGLDGTDHEINEGQYGTAPDGDDFLVLGHESFGLVEAVGPAVRELAPGATWWPGSAGPAPASTTGSTCRT